MDRAWCSQVNSDWFMPSSAAAPGAGTAAGLNLGRQQHPTNRTNARVPRPPGGDSCHSPQTRRSGLPTARLKEGKRSNRTPLGAGRQRRQQQVAAGGRGAHSVSGARGAGPGSSGGCCSGPTIAGRRGKPRNSASAQGHLRSPQNAPSLVPPACKLRAPLLPATSETSTIAQTSATRAMAALQLCGE